MKIDFNIEELKKEPKTKITNLRINVEILEEFEKACEEYGVKKNKAIQWLMVKFTEAVENQKSE